MVSPAAAPAAVVLPPEGRAEEWVRAQLDLELDLPYSEATQDEQVKVYTRVYMFVYMYKGRYVCLYI